MMCLILYVEKKKVIMLVIFYWFVKIDFVFVLLALLNLFADVINFKVYLWIEIDIFEII